MQGREVSRNLPESWMGGLVVWWFRPHLLRVHVDDFTWNTPCRMPDTGVSMADGHVANHEICVLLSYLSCVHVVMGHGNIPWVGHGEAAPTNAERGTDVGRLRGVLGVASPYRLESFRGGCVAG